MTVWARITETVVGISDSISQLIGTGSTPPEKSVAFTIGMIALGAKMAKADGVVTDDEVQAFAQCPERIRQQCQVSKGWNIYQRDR